MNWHKRRTRQQIISYLLKSLRQKIVRNLHTNTNIISKIRDEHLEYFQLDYFLDFDIDEKEQKLDFLAESINQLPARQKETIYLKSDHNFSNTEVAQAINNSSQTVGNNIQKVIFKLKNC